MQFSRLVPIVIEQFFSKNLRKEADALNKRIKQLLDNRNLHLGHIQQEQDLDIAEIDGDSLIMCPPTTMIVRLLQDETKLRREIDTFDDLRHEERCSARDRAHEVHEATRREIEKKLEQMGFDPISPHIHNPTSIIPLMIARHPKVFAAMEEKNALYSQCHDRSSKTHNREALQDAERRLNRTRAEHLQPTL